MGFHGQSPSIARVSEAVPELIVNWDQGCVLNGKD